MANAIYHRSYEVREPVEVRITRQELTIASYPGADRSIRMDELQIGRAVSRRYRNRRIGEFLKELDLAEGRSTGIPKILRAMRENGSPAPVFDTDEGRTWFETRLPVHEQADVELAEQGAEQGAAQGTEQGTAQATEQVERLLAALTREMGRAELQAALRLTHRQHFIAVYLRPALEAGLVEMTLPDKPTSMNQRYRRTAPGDAMVRSRVPPNPAKEYHHTASTENFMQFQWHPNEHPPPIEPASKAKLSVLRQYLRAYFDRLNANPSRDEFRLDLVDGFAGGGVFSDGSESVDGTPLIMLKETCTAESRLNSGRNKPLRFDCRFHFVDKKTEHTDHLRKVLTERGYQVSDGNIKIYTAPFGEVAGQIIENVSRRQPRARRAIFLLDQTGYAQVKFALIARILRELPAAEVILTFAADALTNFLSEKPSFIKSVSPLELSDSKIHDLIRLRDGDGGRALVQRVLRDHTRSLTGAQFDTPFFIRPERSRRALWFFHLSQHPTARDVMIQRHWEISNTFEHYGSGDFGMLGWDTLRDSETLPLFRFGAADEKQLHDQLLISLPKEIFRLASDQPVSVGAFQQAVANRTAARFSDLNSILIELAQEGEIEILTHDGKRRSRALKRLGSSDVICFPETLIFPGWSRFGDLRDSRK